MAQPILCSERQRVSINHDIPVTDSIIEQVSLFAYGPILS